MADPKAQSKNEKNEDDVKNDMTDQKNLINNQKDQKENKVNSLDLCCDKENCLTLEDILKSFNAPLSEEQAWSLIYQSISLYRNFINIEFIDKNTKTLGKRSHKIKVPKSPKNLNVHKDGSVHVNFNDKGELINHFYE
jgi:hypothetical protein